MEPRLIPVELAPQPGPLPAAIRDWLAAAAVPIDEYLGRRACPAFSGFFPSDYEAVYSGLAGLRTAAADRDRLCEWGSGFGVVAGIAALLGFRAVGVEIDVELVAASRRLLGDQGISADIVHGSFVPGHLIEDGAHGTHRRREPADAVPDTADFDVVFAYPFPDEEDLYRDLFADGAAPGSVLMLYSGIEGLRAWRSGAGPW